MASFRFHVLSFLRLLLAYVRDHCDVEANELVRGTASARRVRSALKAARGNIVGECRIQIRREVSVSSNQTAGRRAEWRRAGVERAWAIIS